MPRIRVGIVKKLGHAGPSKIPKAKFSGVHNTNAGFHPKHTQTNVGARMATPGAPRRPAGPTPATKTRKDFKSHGEFVNHIKNYASSPSNAEHSAFAQRLKNDPQHHTVVAKSMNAERQTRRAEAKVSSPQPHIPAHITTPIHVPAPTPMATKLPEKRLARKAPPKPTTSTPIKRAVKSQRPAPYVGKHRKLY